jgi:hypothetical protein
LLQVKKAHNLDKVWHHHFIVALVQSGLLEPSEMGSTGPKNSKLQVAIMEKYCFALSGCWNHPVHEMWAVMENTTQPSVSIQSLLSPKLNFQLGKFDGNDWTTSFHHSICMARGNRVLSIQWHAKAPSASIAVQFIANHSYLQTKKQLPNMDVALASNPNFDERAANTSRCPSIPYPWGDGSSNGFTDNSQSHGVPLGPAYMTHIKAVHTTLIPSNLLCTCWPGVLCYLAHKFERLGGLTASLAAEVRILGGSEASILPSIQSPSSN